MSEATELNMQDLFEMTSDDLMKSATEETVVKTGKYVTKVRALYPKRIADDAEFDAGRTVVSLAVTFYQEDGVTKAGDAFIKTSPEPRYTTRGLLDNTSKRYVELAKALGVKGNNTGETYTVVQQQAFMTKVREVYVVPGNELHPTHSEAKVNPQTGDAWVTVESDQAEEREHYLALGLEPRVMVDRIYKLK